MPFVSYEFSRRLKALKKLIFMCPKMNYWWLILMLSLWHYNSTVVGFSVVATSQKPIRSYTNDITCWVKTVIEVPNITEPIDSDSFKLTMEYRLASVYNLAMNTYRSMLPRTRRAATFGNATIQMVYVIREWSDIPTRVDLIYTLTRFNRQNCTSANDTVFRMYLVPLQRVAIMLGYVVITAAESYIPEPASLLWVIGAVIGGLCGIFLIVWCFLYIYCKFRQAPQHTVKLSIHPEIVSNELPDSETVTKKIAARETSRGEATTQRKTKKQRQRPDPTSLVVNQFDDPLTSDVASLQLQVNMSALNNSSRMPIEKLTVNKKTKQRKKRRKEVMQKKTCVVEQVITENGSMEDQKTSPTSVPSLFDSIKREQPKLVAIHHTPIFMDTRKATNRSNGVEWWSPYSTGDLATKIIGELNEKQLNETRTPLNGNSTNSTLDFHTAFQAAVQLLPEEMTSQSESEGPYGIVVTMSSDDLFQQPSIKSRNSNKPKRDTNGARLMDDYSVVVINSKILESSN